MAKNVEEFFTDVGVNLFIFSIVEDGFVEVSAIA